MSKVETSAAPAAVLSRDPALGRSRIQSVDALRGAIMIIMALDHIRDYINAAAMNFSPTDLTRTNAPIFFTRWITHFCAPVFALTAGIGAFLWLGRSRSRAQLSRFLVTRGLWLMLLEVTLLRWIMFFQFGFSGQLTILTVLWMLGLCMVVLAGLIHLPTRMLAVVSMVVIAGHNMLDHVRAESFGQAAWIWDMVHQQGVFRIHEAAILVAYPLVPWVAVMATGYCLGQVFRWNPERRQKFLLWLGAGLSAAFVLLRALNVYGDPARWAAQNSKLVTVLSFLNTTKYPPSLLFLMMTLGPALMAMAWLERRRFSEGNPIIVFGRVPFFFFIVHLAVIHGVAILIAYLRYGWTNFLLLPAPSMGSMRKIFPADYGVSLWAVYAVWFGVIVLTYPLCRWFAGVKRRRRDWWLSYL